ncbi:MAG: Alpha-D-glucose-phosphate phosphatase YihX [Bacteroidota bacterium]|jgi:2-haloacid dehalogenase
MSQTIDTVIFDLGGVLIDWNPDYVFDRFFKDAAQKKHFYRHICTSDWNEEQDAGRSIQEATEELVARHPGWEDAIRAYYGRWEEMLGGAIGETVEILQRLREAGRHRLYALTNWSAETFPVALERYEFLHWFEGIVVSGEEKTRKPFPVFYEILFQRYAVDPSSALFIDDNARNVEAGRLLGLHTVHFRSSAQLAAELAAKNIL